jgi:hypothetical protein
VSACMWVRMRMQLGALALALARALARALAGVRWRVLSRCMLASRLALCVPCARVHMG